MENTSSSRQPAPGPSSSSSPPAAPTPAKRRYLTSTPLPGDSSSEIRPFETSISPVAPPMPDELIFGHSGLVYRKQSGTFDRYVNDNLPDRIWQVRRIPLESKEGDILHLLRSKSETWPFIQIKGTTYDDQFRYLLFKPMNVSLKKFTEGKERLSFHQIRQVAFQLVAAFNTLKRIVFKSKYNIHYPNTGLEDAGIPGLQPWTLGDGQPTDATLTIETTALQLDVALHYEDISGTRFAEYCHYRLGCGFSLDLLKYLSFFQMPDYLRKTNWTNFDWQTTGTYNRKDCAQSDDSLARALANHSVQCLKLRGFSSAWCPLLEAIGAILGGIQTTAVHSSTLLDSTRDSRLEISNVVVSRALGRGV